MTGAQPRAFFTDLPSLSLTPMDLNKKAQLRLEFVNNARNIARENIIRATDERAKSANKKRHHTQFSIGEECYVLQMTRPTGVATFYWRPYDGPYVIIGKSKPDVYILRRHNWSHKKSVKVHVERLKPFCRLVDEPEFPMSLREDNDETQPETALDLPLINDEIDDNSSSIDSAPDETQQPNDIDEIKPRTRKRLLNRIDYQK